MKETIGSSMLLYIVVIIIGIVGTVFAATNNYSKAYKAKNNIISIINNDYMINHGKKTVGATEIYHTDCFHSTATTAQRNSCIEKISATLSNMGYSMSAQEASVCTEILNSKGYSALVYPSLLSDKFEGYCIFKVNVNLTDYYYTVVTFNHMNIKAFNLGSLYKTSVYGQTRIYSGA